MKIDRLIGITMYLLNRDKASAKELADRFEVSVRTIVRDMDALSGAGIPIASYPGSGGGYAILDTYRLDRRFATAADYRNILTALQALLTAYDSRELSDTAEKLPVQSGPPQHVFFDFSVCREGTYTEPYLRLLDRAIGQRQIVRFDYTGADGICHPRRVQPLALSYRWYAWYLFAFCEHKQDYRIFKLNRMEHLTALSHTFPDIHGDTAALLRQHWERDRSDLVTVTLRCRPVVRAAVMEHFHPELLEQEDSGALLYRFTVPQNERFWFSMLLGFGNDVEVLEPAWLRQRLTEKAEEILALYENHDNTLSGFG